MIRRGVLSILLVALIAAGASWQERAPETRAADGAVSLPRPTGVDIDGVVRARADIVTAGFAEQRSAKSRPRLELSVVVSLAVLTAVAISYLYQLVPGRPSILWRGNRVNLRAPPLLRLV